MSAALQLLGLGLISLGALLWSIPVGLIVTGVALVLVGVSVTNA